MDNFQIWTDTWGETEKQDALKLKGPIFIIGASGFIGANLFYSLKALRDDVYACSRNPQKSWRLTGVDSAYLLNVDITESEKLKDIIINFLPATFFNLSA